MKIKLCARFSHNSKWEVWSLSATPPPSDVTRVVLIYRYQKIPQNALPSLKHERPSTTFCFCVVVKFAQMCARYRLQNHLNEHLQWDFITPPEALARMNGKPYSHWLTRKHEAF